MAISAARQNNAGVRNGGEGLLRIASGVALQAKLMSAGASCGGTPMAALRAVLCRRPEARS